MRERQIEIQLNSQYLHSLFQLGGEPLGLNFYWMQGRGEAATQEGNGEARCRPPKSRAWLRDDKVSPSEVDCNLRETVPLPRNILHTCGLTNHRHTGQRTYSQLDLVLSVSCRDWTSLTASAKVGEGQLDYPTSVREATAGRTGLGGNHHLNHLVESSSGERGKLLARCQSEQSTDECKEWRSRRSSQSMGKPCTRRRTAACRDFRRKGNRMTTGGN